MRSKARLDRLEKEQPTWPAMEKVIERAFRLEFKELLQAIYDDAATPEQRQELARFWSGEHAEWDHLIPILDGQWPREKWADVLLESIAKEYGYADYDEFRLAALYADGQGLADSDGWWQPRDVLPMVKALSAQRREELEEMAKTRKLGREKQLYA